MQFLKASSFYDQRIKNCQLILLKGKMIAGKIIR